MSALSEQEEDKRESINKSSGFNASEEYLAQLCEKTFLSLWSYPNLFRTPAKELADLVVVFGNDILIFSDKHCEYPETEDDKLNWNRWFKRAVLKSANQLWGAENWIKKYPDRIFLDSKCTKIFPFQINAENSRVHLIMVARGVSDASKKYFKGGSGSLLLKSFIKGEASHTEPFTIGDLDPNKSFVHIFDDITLDVIMSTLDTIKDFTAYLSKKEVLFRSNKIIAATGEEDLLPFYLKGLINNEHDFEFPETSDGFFIDEGHWEHFSHNPQRKAQLIENEQSYLWDYIIERFNTHALGGTQYVVSSGGIRDSEKIMRFFASESRLSRRMLAKGLGDLILKTPKNIVGRRVAMPFNKEGVYYVFIVFPRMGRTDEEYRLMRSEYLTWCCQIVRAKYPMAQDIIGFATESGVENESRSEDAIYFDGRIWNDEMQIQAEEISKKLNIMVDPKPYRVHVQEYPEIIKQRPKKAVKVGRNDPCPCGSGKKFKRCHGR